MPGHEAGQKEELLVMDLARTARVCNDEIDPRLIFLIAPQRRWDRNEYKILRLRLALSGPISDDEAVRTFARFRYGGAQ